MRSTLILAAVLSSSMLASEVHAGEEDELAEAGFPAVSRPWQGLDYQKAAEVLGTVKAPLPRFSTRKGAAFLQRMTSTANFSFARSKALPFESRFEDFRRMIVGAQSVLLVYLKATMDGRDPPHEELARLMAFMLHLAGLGVELTDEFVPTIQKDEHYASRMEGLKRMHLGITQVFQGAELSLSESSYSFTPRDRSILLEAMSANLPQIKKAFSSDVVIEMRKRLEGDKARFNGKDALTIEQMIADLR